MFLLVLFCLVLQLWTFCCKERNVTTHFVGLARGIL